ncbi:conserved protein of unknown function [Hyphomicrobium sp. 1Nfss2.1]|uniref:hypothetical protein n=1 Tax=Hyphomicrobium sp. 1Nfss2.1 TaxID=3413936 RepID=UPI003C7E8704
MSEEIDVMNKFGVSVGGGGIALLVPPRTPMTKDEALVLAAWLVALADPLGERFEKVLDAVLST